jgi:hypothetical protein
VVGATRALWFSNESSPDLPAFPDDFGNDDLDRHADIFDVLQYAFGFQVCSLETKMLLFYVVL